VAPEGEGFEPSVPSRSQNEIGGEVRPEETRRFCFLTPTRSQQMSRRQAQTEVAYQGLATQTPTPFRPIATC
jgi:hypothetical protein